ncbi:Glucan 1,3-beta-glucosidase like [Melia azedarach]|uniref:Glucan 1,3-beta-glucosidase like n=1 Tax=Melia azedarach TaxID=155640 RepID=A0ACC1WQZ3_MELAZ|nr:Glucan 1,3-beta-glucosidase like [Melia azedarach]
MASPTKTFWMELDFRFKSVTVGKFLCAELGGGTIIVANRSAASTWETFRLWRISETNFQLRVFNKQFVGLKNNGNGIDVVAESNTPGSSETFEIVRNSNDLNRVRIKAPNGLFLQVKTEDLVTADRQAGTSWGDDDPSVFVINFSGRLEGEFQVTNGYGPVKAPQIMREHWNTFIVEDDFKVHSWKWIKCCENTCWLVDSKAGFEHSSSRDGSQEWGLTDGNIQQTVTVIDFLSARYAKNPSLYAVELINEPFSPGVSLESLTKYYKAGYDAVRKHSSTAFVVMSNRLGPMDPRELFPLANGLNRIVIDVHYYNLFTDTVNGMTVQQNIDFSQRNQESGVESSHHIKWPSYFGR